MKHTKKKGTQQVLNEGTECERDKAVPHCLYERKALPSCWPWRFWGLCILSSRLELRSEFTADILVESLISNSSLSIELSSCKWKISGMCQKTSHTVHIICAVHSFLVVSFTPGVGCNHAKSLLSKQAKHIKNCKGNSVYVLWQSDRCNLFNWGYSITALSCFHSTWLKRASNQRPHNKSLLFKLSGGELSTFPACILYLCQKRSVALWWPLTGRYFWMGTWPNMSPQPNSLGMMSPFYCHCV